MVSKRLVFEYIVLWQYEAEPSMQLLKAILLLIALYIFRVSTKAILIHAQIVLVLNDD